MNLGQLIEGMKLFNYCEHFAFCLIDALIQYVTVTSAKTFEAEV